MTLFLGIWDTDDYLGRTDQTFDLSQFGACGRWQSATIMATKAKKVPFDSKVFLATVNGGRSISKYRMNQKVFAQGTPADAVFYQARSKSPLSQSRARKPSSRYWAPTNSAERDA